jgi:hypothetical protein
MPPTPGRALGTYLLHLVMYENALDKHLEDPTAYMTKFGLSPAKQDILLSGDLESIVRQVEEEFGKRPGDFMIP